jgi:hypothetical protein
MNDPDTDDTDAALDRLADDGNPHGDGEDFRKDRVCGPIMCKKPPVYS